MADKMTKRDLFGAVIGILDEVGADSTLIDGMLHEVDLLDRKHNAGPNPKHTSEQKMYASAIASVLAGSAGKRASEIASETDLSVQRVTAVVRKMVAAGEVSRNENGKVVTFTLN